MRRADSLDLPAPPAGTLPGADPSVPRAADTARSGHRAVRFNLLRSVPFRLVLAISAVYLVCFTLAGCVFYELMRDRLSNEIDQSISRKYAQIEAVHQHSGLAAVLDRVRGSDQDPMQYNLGLHLATADGQRIAGNVTVAITAPGWHNLSARELGMQGDAIHYRFYTGYLGDRLLSVGRSIQPLIDLRTTAFNSFGWTLLSSLLLALLGAGYLSWYTHKRIQTIARAMDRVAAGNLDARLPISRAADDIDNLAWQINEALTRLQQMVDSVRQVSTDIAHDLKTPLNRLFIRVEEAAELSRQGRCVDTELTQALAEAQDINATFEALLRIAQIEAGARRAQFGTVDLLQVLDTTAEIYEAVAEERGHVLQLVACPDPASSTTSDGSPLAASGPDTVPRLPLCGDRELLMQMVVNLVENAITHCPPGSQIALHAGESADTVWCRVCDNGPGVPAGERERVLRRLYRLEASRTTSGTGLGLSLVKAVADLHCGSVTLSDNQPGLCVTVTFPRECTSP